MFKTVLADRRMGWKKEELLMSTHPSPLRAEGAGKIPPTRTLPFRKILRVEYNYQWCTGS